MPSCRTCDAATTNSESAPARHCNAALYRIVLTRLRYQSGTRDYSDRRIAEGKTSQEIIRCLKRYVAREIYNLLPRSTTPAPAPQN